MDFIKLKAGWVWRVPALAGTMDEFFSSTDNRDDLGTVKLAGVIGHCSREHQPSWLFRLCALGLFLDLELAEFMRCRVCGVEDEAAIAQGYWVRPDLCSRCL
ncbi:MAG TPA: hypothetical protein VGO08_20945 [Burkholderiales bacterium]|nr:hypothetical protein [Burkholderiales bacterium]